MGRSLYRSSFHKSHSSLPVRMLLYLEHSNHLAVQHRIFCPLLQLCVFFRYPGLSSLQLDNLFIIQSPFTLSVHTLCFQRLDSLLVHTICYLHNNIILLDALSRYQRSLRFKHYHSLM